MQLLLLLEVRKLLKLLGVAYLEGRLKSRSYGIVYIAFLKYYCRICTVTMNKNVIALFVVLIEKCSHLSS